MPLAEDDIFNLQRVSFATGVDIVLVIDGTGSMSPIIDQVKKNALSLHDKLIEALGKYKRKVERLRIKVIVFRDYFVDSAPMEESKRFFILPEDKEALFDFVNRIEPSGGGDEPESALEALYFAIKSEWKKELTRQRQIIVMMTDASAHKLDEPQRFVDPMKIYPSQIPDNLVGLQSVWNDRQGKMDPHARRLIIFAPNDYPWNDMAAKWDSTVYIPSKAGDGLKEIDMGVIIDFVGKSI